jgi:hypothetical protein
VSDLRRRYLLPSVLPRLLRRPPSNLNSRTLCSPNKICISFCKTHVQSNKTVACSNRLHRMLSLCMLCSMAIRPGATQVSKRTGAYSQMLGRLIWQWQIINFDCAARTVLPLMGILSNSAVTHIICPRDTNFSTALQSSSYRGLTTRTVTRTNANVSGQADLPYDRERPLQVRGFRL